MQILINWDSSVTRMSSSLRTAFEAAVTYAADYLDKILATSYRVTINVGWGEITQGGISTPIPEGESLGGPNDLLNYSYAQVSAALKAHENSTATDSAYSDLPTTDPTDGQGIWIPVIEAEALGLDVYGLSGSASGSVGFSAETYYNFSMTDRAVSNEADFVGIAEHEIAHAIGRISEVNDSGFTILDLFRFSALDTLSTSATQNPYFSVDGGQTPLKYYDPSDPADWVFPGSNEATDAFDAFYTFGVEDDVSATDLKLLNAIGYSLSQSSPADFNGDGISDILLTSASTGDIVEWLMNGTTIASNVRIAELGSNTGWSVVDLGDYNGDGKSDILLQNTGTGQIALWLMNGTTIASNQTIAQLIPGWTVYQGSNLAFTTAPGTAVPQDFNGDGKSDILLQNSATGQIAEWLMNGTTISSNVKIAQLDANTSWSVVATGDFNGDGKSDILLQNSNTGQINEWLMNGTTIVSNQQIAQFNSGWLVAGIGDFNGDGKSDILLQNAGTGQINEWLMNGTTIVSNQQIAQLSSGWSIAGIGDFDGDGKSDILLENAGTGQINMWLMNGTTIASNQQIANLGANSGWSVAGLGDYNGDGKTDILVQNAGTGQINEWLMNGTTIASNQQIANLGPSSGWTLSLHH